MEKILLTAFEPFGGESINPSWEIAKILDGAIIENNVIISHCLPCAFRASLDSLEKIIKSSAPKIVISLGQAGGRAEITPEKVAINWNDARIPDNLDQQPCDVVIHEDAPNAYFSTLPIKAIVQVLNENGIPSSISYTAGTYVCNHVFFGLQHLASKYKIKQSGFVHIPYLPSQAVKKGAPSMSKDTLLDALKIIIKTTLINPSDLSIPGGSIC